MDARRIAALAAVGAVIAWAAKAVAIWVAGGLDESPLEGPLFVVGFLCLLIAFGAVGVALTRGRSTGLRVLGAVAALVVGLVLFVLVESLVGSLVPDDAGWVQEEAGLWVVSVATAAVLLAWLARSREHTRA